MLDTTFSIEMLSRFISNLEKPHWNVVQRLMRYLKGTMDLCRLYMLAQRPIALVLMMINS